MKMEHPDPKRLLLFDWSNQENRSRFLVISLVVTSLGILASFVFFRVVVASGKIANVAGQSIVVLSPSSLAAQHLIDYASDQSYLLLTDNPEHEQAPHSLANASPVFVPGFKDFSLRLRDLGQTQSPELRPRLFSPASALLPPVTIDPSTKSKQKPSSASPSPEHPFVGVSSELRSRWISPSSLPNNKALGPNSSVVFRVAVNPMGLVVTAVPLSQQELAPVSLISDIDDYDPEELHRFVRRLRFKPEPSLTSIQWATLTVSWRAQP